MGFQSSKEEAEKRKSQKRKSQSKEDRQKEGQGVQKGRKVAKRDVFPMFCGSGRSNSRFAKAAGAEPSGQLRNQKLHAAVVRSRF